MPHRYLTDHAVLAHATTQHAAQGRTTSTAHVLVDGLEDRQGLYVAMSRGRHANYAYCVTNSSGQADIQAGSRPDPELDRARRLASEHAGHLPPKAAHPEQRDQQASPITVLAAIIARDGSQRTATDTLASELARADHLGILGGIWDDVTRRVQRTRFRQALRDALPDDDASQALADPASTWLWRTLREAEAGGLDGGRALREVIAERPLTGARDIARVLDARLRRRLDRLQPQPRSAWTRPAPATGSADLDRYLAELAEAMQDRMRRLGEHAAAVAPAWALQSLGPVPAGPAERTGWEQRASVIAGYRERYGYEHPADPIGPLPGKASPEARAAWHAALAVLGRVDGIDLRACTDGELWLRRSIYERETAWAPPHVAEELRLVRVAQCGAHVSAVRARHEAAAAPDLTFASRHRQLAGIWDALEAKAASEADIFEGIQATRCDWETMTDSTRRIAIAADSELRRRHPGTDLEPLTPHPAESDGIVVPTIGQQATWVQATLDGDPDVIESAGLPDDRQPEPLAAALGLTPETAMADIPEQVHRIRDKAQRIQAALSQLASLTLPREAHDDRPPGLAWPPPPRPGRSAVLQPPRPEIVPAVQVAALHQAASGDPEAER